MKLTTIFKGILREQSELKELFGISFDARAWNSRIYSQIKLAKGYAKRNMPIPDLTLYGKDYPKEYQSFPVDVLNLFLNVKYDNGAAYDENKSGYDENKQYHIYLHFGPDADASSINHELRHAYEDFRRMSQGNVPMKNTKEGINLFGGDFENFLTTGRHIEPFWTLMYGLYVTSKIERSGYAESVYDNAGPIIEMVVQVMNVTNANILSNYSPETLSMTWQALKKKYKVPIIDKFQNYESFIKWAQEEIQYKGQKTLKKLRKVKFYRIQNKKRGK
jgi:hypothetical protein